MRKITAKETLASLQRVLAAHPDGRNDECVYFYDGKPACIVGHVILDLHEHLPSRGIPVDPEFWDGVDSIPGSDDFPRLFKRDAVIMLAAVQVIADSGNGAGTGQRPSWKEAVRRAGVTL